MEAIRSLIRGDLSPAGNKISVVRDSQKFDYAVDGYDASWVDSGTSALALALLNARKKAQNIVNPKVIIPGYCCPDLVAAAVHAGVKPLVVDIGVNDASYDLDALSASLSDENIIAVIAVNFLGIKERLQDIKKIIAHKPIKIIEDNAQWFPESKDQHQFAGDYVLFSFGRGKPLSLLGGGVLFSKEPLLVSDIILQDEPNAKKQLIKTRLYNILLNPHFYCYLNRAPFLRLGETHYHQHDKIATLGSFQKDVFNHNLLRYEARNTDIEQDYKKLFTLVDLQDLSSINTSRCMRLLRFPLLCKSSGQRDKILELLTSQGLGASPLYQRAIVEIPMVRELVEVLSDLPNARQFARRFLTLPTHKYVTRKHISRIKDVLLSVPARA